MTLETVEMSALNRIEPSNTAKASHYLLATNKDVWLPTIIEAKATAEKNEVADGWHVGTGCRYPGSLQYEFAVYVKDPVGRGVCWQMRPDTPPVQDRLAPRNQTRDKIVSDLLFGDGATNPEEAVHLLRVFHSAVVLSFLSGPAWTSIPAEERRIHANTWSQGVEGLVLTAIPEIEEACGFECDPWNIGTGGPLITSVNLAVAAAVTATM